MKDVADDLAELAGAADATAWRVALEDIAEERGYYDALGADHAALFADAGPVLLVSFETEPEVRARDGRAPLGWALARPAGWSSLVLTSRGRSWFRDPEIYGYFDRLVDDGFFDAFDQVIFTGAGPCGYAAAAYSVAAPGATVIVLAPQATLTPARAGWDSRFPEARRLDFTSRYGDAALMCEAATAAFVLFDPAEREDAMHAALFAAAGASTLPARHFGGELAGLLEHSGALGEIVTAAAEGRLDATTVFRALRARRTQSPWLRHLLAAVEARGDPALVKRLCACVLASGKRAPRFRDGLDRAERALAERDH